MKVFKRIYHFLVRLTGYEHYRMIKKGKRIFEGWHVEESAHYFVCSHGIGDIVWMASFINAYLDAAYVNKDKVYFVCMKRDVKILKSYMSFADFITTDKNELIQLGRFALSKTNKSHSLSALIFPELKKRDLMVSELDILSQIGAEMDICYKYGCFDLGESARFEAPRLMSYDEEADDFIKKNGLKIGKTVILVPFANSRLMLPYSDWSVIADKLNRIGYQVYTNIGSEKDSIIEGTMPLFSPLELLPLIIRKVGCAITGRCGLGDWIFVNSCDMAVIHTYKEGEHLTKNELIQSSFAKKESFIAMRERCHIKEGMLQEYRMKQNGDNSECIVELIEAVKGMMEWRE